MVGLGFFEINFNEEVDTMSTSKNAVEAVEHVTLKLVGGKRYYCAKAKNDVILKGELVTVSPEVADLLLEDVYTDASNNEHPYFVETSEEQEKALSTAKAKRVARRSTPKATVADSEE